MKFSLNMEDNIVNRMTRLIEFMKASRENHIAVIDFDCDGKLLDLLDASNQLNCKAINLRVRINDIFHTANSRHRVLFKKEFKEVERLDRMAKEYNLKASTIAEYVLQQFEEVFDF